MHKKIKYIGVTFLLLGAFALATVAILLLSVVISLLINEDAHTGDETATTDVAEVLEEFSSKPTVEIIVLNR